MHSAKNQYAPFEFDGADDDPDVYRTLRRLTQPDFDPGEIDESPVFALVTNPKDGDVFGLDEAIHVRASVSGASRIEGLTVRFFANGRQIGETNEGQSRIRWEGVEPGSYDLVAVVFDGVGEERVRSGPVDIVIR